MSRILVDGQTLSTHEMQRGIGQVFVNTVFTMAKYDLRHDVFLFVRSDAQLELLPERLLKNVTIIRNDQPPSPPSDPEGQIAYLKTLNRVIDEYAIDWYWNPNPFMMNVSFPGAKPDCKLAITLYDLIPWQKKDDYLYKWSPEQQADYSSRLDLVQRECDAIISISQTSADVFLDYFPDASPRVFCAPIGYDQSKFWSFSFDFDPFSDPFILTVSGGDPRKGTDTLIEAFAAMIKDGAGICETIRLFICGSFDPTHIEAFLDQAGTLGIRDRVTFTGYLPDAKIASLTRRAILSVFPSMLEGFGLPILEALASGVPVVAADIPTSREVAGDTGFYFPAGDAAALTSALAECLTKRQSGEIQKHDLLRRARKFDWMECARTYGDVLATIRLPFGSEGRFHFPERALKIAMLTPWPPQKSGIADYSFELAGTLCKYSDLTVVTHNCEAPLPQNGCSIITMQEFEARVDEFDEVVVHIGNNTAFHEAFYKFAIEHRSTVICHDPNIHPFIKEAFHDLNKASPLYDAALEDPANMDEAISMEVFSSNLTGHIARRSKSMYFHSRTARRSLEDKFRNDKDAPGFFSSVIPVRPPAPVAEAAIHSVANILEGHEDRIIIGMFGHINRQKRIASVFEAISNLTRKGVPISLLIVGEPVDTSIDLERSLEEFQIARFAIRPGYVDLEVFEGLLVASDIIVTLRNPTMGEASAALYRALCRQKTCIVSDTGQFAEIPDDCVWHISTDETEAMELEILVESLCLNPKTRAALSTNGGQYAAQYCNHEGFVSQLLIEFEQ